MAGITMRELSQQLGVSVATISMVLNNRPGISEETRLRVLEAAKSSGYDIGKLSAASSRRKAELSLVILKSNGRIIDGNVFFSVLIESMERTAASEGYDLSIRYLTVGSEVPREVFSRDGGVILLCTEISEEVLATLPQPTGALVVLDNACPRLPLNTVAIDNLGGIDQAVQHLAQQGHRRIGYLKSAMEIPNFEERFAAFCAAVDRLDLERGDVLISSQEQISRWLEEHELSTRAFVTDNDMVALAGLNAFRERGLRLGEDLSIVGFDDLPMAQINDPPLTTIRVYNDSLGETAVRRIIDLIQNPDQPYQHIRIGTALKERSSVRQVK